MHTIRYGAAVAGKWIVPTIFVLGAITSVVNRSRRRALIRNTNESEPRKSHSMITPAIPVSRAAELPDRNARTRTPGAHEFGGYRANYLVLRLNKLVRP